MAFLQALYDSIMGRTLSLEKFTNHQNSVLKVFHVACGDCNGCVLELQALMGAAFDLSSSGIVFVDHPSGADLLLITGLLNRPMIPYLERSWEFMTEPKAIVTLGKCANNRHIFKENYTVFAESADGDECILQIDGCPPSPSRIMKNLMNLKVDQNQGKVLYRDSPSSFHSESLEHSPSICENCDSLAESGIDTEYHLKPKSPKDQQPK